jgi:tetratricopeptide (TPR) repeat protein
MKTTFSLIVFGAVFTGGHLFAQSWDGFSTIADQYQNADDYRTAETLRREALRQAEEQVGKEDKALAPLLTKLAVLLHAEGKDADAEQAARRAVQIAERSNDSQITGVALNALGVILNPAEGEPVLLRSIALLEQAEGADSLDVAKARNNLATIYSGAHQYAKAEEQMAKALPVYEKRLGPNNPAIALALSNMFTILLSENRTTEAEPYLKHALSIAAEGSPNDLRMANLKLCQASLEMKRGNYSEAARLLQTVAAIQRKVLGAESPQVAQTLASYADASRHAEVAEGAALAQDHAHPILKTLH